MKGNDRKAAVNAYKERKVIAGIYAVRCGPSGECWVGQAPDLSTVQNRLWFTLRQGNGPWRALQAAWRSHGPDAFSFEVLERIEGEDIAYLRDGILKDRLAQWTGELKASSL